MEEKKGVWVWITVNNEATWRTRHRWENNIKMYFKEIGFGVCGLDSSVSEYGFCDHGNGHRNRIGRLWIGIVCL
jgi:hypothetical protein